jgi:ABC-type uncharacterized transport system substrate-binding protein
VDSEAPPGGNVTGFVVWDRSIGGKWIRLLGEIAPKLTRVGVIYNPDTAPYVLPLIASAKAAAGSLAVIECPVRDDSEIEAMASLVAREPHGGLLILPEPFTIRSLPSPQVSASRPSIRFRAPRDVGRC